MAARKSKARTVEAPSVADRAIEAIKSVASRESEDPRPAAWLRALIAKASGKPFPKDVRVHLDDRFTGRDRIAQVKALIIIGKTPEEAADAILEAAMDEHRGEKHCNW